MPRDTERAVWEVAARQSGYLTRRQALACGMSEAMIHRRVRVGLWRRVKAGVYLLPGHASTLQGRLAAATAALGAVVSHESAAEIHDLPQVRRGMAVVTVPANSTNRFPEVVVHQSTDLVPRFVVEIDHLPVTTPLRTVVDLASVVTPGRLERIVDRCLVEHRFDLAALHDCVEMLARHGKPGISRLRRVLEVRQPGYVPTESELERRMAEFLHQHGFPDPVRQHPLPWRTPRAGRVDFAYPARRLLIEVDGRAWHTAVAAFDEDRMRDNHAQLAGWRTIRVTHRMLADRPLEVRRLIAVGLGLAA